MIGLKGTPFEMLATNPLTKWRKNTFWTKEPETIQWIRSFGKDYNHTGDNNNTKYREPVFVDIGANVGIYSLYAAWLYPAMRIIAIEPDINNYMELIQNINLNGFRNIIPMNMAIGAYCKTLHFQSTSQIAGNSFGNLVEFPSRVNQHGIELFGRALLSITIDYLSQISKIDFIKIDIDGGEYDAVFGMKDTLGKMKTMLIEFDTADSRYGTIKNYINGGGYIPYSEINSMSDHSRHRRKEEGHGHIENIVFKKMKPGMAEDH